MCGKCAGEVKDRLSELFDKINEKSVIIKVLAEACSKLAEIGRHDLVDKLLVVGDVEFLGSTEEQAKATIAARRAAALAEATAQQTAAAGTAPATDTAQQQGEQLKRGPLDDLINNLPEDFPPELRAIVDQLKDDPNVEMKVYVVK